LLVLTNKELVLILFSSLLFFLRFQQYLLHILLF